MAKRFTEAKKAKVLAAVEGGMTIAAAAKQFGCAAGSISAWRRAASKVPKAKVAESDCPELKDVDREYEVVWKAKLAPEELLKLENTYLKARIAYLEAQL